MSPIIEKFKTIVTVNKRANISVQSIKSALSGFDLPSFPDHLIPQGFLHQPINSAPTTQYNQTLHVNELLGILFATFPENSSNRDVSPDRLSQIAADIAAGDWESTQEIQIGVNNNGMRRLIDGQHRVVQNILNNGSLPMSIKWYNCDSDRARALLVARDTCRPKSESDRIRALGGLSEYNFTNEQKKRFISALNLIIRDGFSRTASAQTGKILAASSSIKIEALEEWAPYAKQWFGIQDHCILAAVKSKMKTTATMAFGLVTLRLHKEKAYDFWNQISTQPLMVNSNTPAKEIIDTLTNNLIKQSPGEYARILGHHYSCWYADQEGVSKKRRSEHENSLYLINSPYDGNVKYFIPNNIKTSHQEILDIARTQKLDVFDQDDINNGRISVTIPRNINIKNRGGQSLARFYDRNYTIKK